jgi:uncharacterized membrane protein YeaQ/YmgE (transglycosylase-associated protein family)
MNLIIWLVVGGVIGWLASIVMRTDASQGILLNVVVGIIGALLAGFVIAPLFGTGTINSNDFSLSGLLVSFVGAVVLLAIVNLFRRGAPR